MALELEARFRADDAGTLRRLAGRDTLGVARLGEARTVVEIDRYLDTTDGRLAAARWACRLRSREGDTRISLKGPPEGSGDEWLHRRPELEGPASAEIDPGAWPPSPALAFLAELSGQGPLVETLRLTQERTERAVAVEGRTVGTLTLDAVTAERAGERLGEMHVVELEIRADGVELDLAPLADELSREPGVSPEPRTKLELALAMGATSG
jgi:inorganic triphosphatase YgiF